MIGRRGLFAGGLCAGGLYASGLRAAGASALAPGSAQANLPVPEGDELTFRVVRGTWAIGTHALRFVRRADLLEVRIAVDLRVGLGPLTLYRYTGRATELWRDGQFESYDGTTDDGGTHYVARATRDARGLWVEGTNTPRYLAPSNALPATHWNKAELNGPWINPQDGRLDRPAVARVGEDQVSVGNGQPVSATQYAMSGDVQMDLWYDSTPSWVALHFKARDGSLIHYERV
jgi:hypothetical protein